MKHLILLLVVLLNAIAASAACTPDDYDRRQAESFMREAEYYRKKADSYRREADYYMKKAESYQREAAYYTRRGDADRAKYYLRQADRHGQLQDADALCQEC